MALVSRAVFLDRDGVLVRDVGNLNRPEDIEILPMVPSALAALEDCGFKLVVVSNQPVVARGMLSENEVKELNGRIFTAIREMGGPHLRHFYFCPHHPRADVERYRVDCHCRKPRPGMLMQAASELGLGLAGSYMVGDRISDVSAGKKAGCKAVQILTGMHLEPPIQSPDSFDPALAPDLTVADLLAAASWILADT